MFLFIFTCSCFSLAFHVLKKWIYFITVGPKYTHFKDIFKLLWSFHLVWRKFISLLLFWQSFLNVPFLFAFWDFNFQLVVSENPSPTPRHPCSPFLVNVLECFTIQYHRILTLIWTLGLLFHGYTRNRADWVIESMVACSKLSTFSCLPRYTNQCLLSA